MRENQRPIRLCFVMPGTYQLFHKVAYMEHGGAELNLYYLSKMFSEDPNYEVSFLVEDQCQKHIEYYDKVKVIRLTGLRWGEHKPKSKLNKLWKKIVVEFSTAYEMLHANYDIVLVTTGSLILSRLVFWGQKLGRKKIVFRFANDSDVDPHYFEKTGEGKLKDRIYWWGVKKTKALVFQTSQQEKLFQSKENRSGTVIENGFVIEPQKKEIIKDSILWVSRANEVKRPQLLLELAKRLPEEKFVMIMPGNNEISASIEEQAKHIKNLEFIHYVPFEEIIKYFQRAKLFINTSTYEGFPNTFIQCGIASTPILSFCINPDHIIDRYHLGYVCNDSLERGIEFIKNLDLDSVKTYGNNVRNYTIETHDIKNTFHRYDELFQRLYLREDFKDVTV